MTEIQPDFEVIGFFGHDLGLKTSFIILKTGEGSKPEIVDND